MEPYRLGATEVVARTRNGDLTVEEYAQSLLRRIQDRDHVVKAWAYLDPECVLTQARELDRIAPENRGPLHGVAVAVKDVMYTKGKSHAVKNRHATVLTIPDMPTQFNSPIYEDDAPKVDAASVIVLRQAGALILGKTTTTEFAGTTGGPPTSNPHDASRTPGGSSAGSAAAVGDFQAPVALGTQTGGSTIRPGSFSGVYALKPTWNAVSREGQRIYSLSLDTIGFFARSVPDLELLADVFALQDDATPDPSLGIRGARFAVCRTMVWPRAGPGTVAAMDRAGALLRGQGAQVDELELPDGLENLPAWHATVLASEGRTAFLPEYRVAKEKLSKFLAGHVENETDISRAAQLEAYDRIAAARPLVDKILKEYTAVIVPSVPDEAPSGTESTGSAIFNVIWTALHTPVVNIPGFAGPNGMPVGLSLVAPRYYDRHLLVVSKKVGEVFESNGGWKPSV